MYNFTRYKFIDPVLLGDHIDKMIADRNLSALKQIVIEGNYIEKLKGRIFPAKSLDLLSTLENLQLRIKAIHVAIKDNDQDLLKQLVDQWDNVYIYLLFNRSYHHISCKTFIPNLLLCRPFIEL